MKAEVHCLLCGFVPIGAQDLLVKTSHDRRLRPAFTAVMHETFKTLDVESVEIIERRGLRIFTGNV